MSAAMGDLRGLRGLGLLALAALLGACAPTLPVVVKPVACELPADRLAATCDAPRALPDGLTYADLISVGIDDRKALRACGAQQQALVAMIRACQGTIKSYNDQLVEINQKISGKP